MNFCLIYVTARDAHEAETIGRHLVRERLAACINILPTIRSIYHWQGQVHEDHETPFLIKTKNTAFDAVCQRVKELHSYQTPCLIKLAVPEVEAAFGQWLDAQVD